MRYSAFSPTWSSNEEGWTKAGKGQWESGEPWLKTPGSRVEKSITRLLAALNAHVEQPLSKLDYNRFKTQLLQTGFLRKNMEASKQFLAMGALNEVEELKLCSMLWFISSVYPAYQELFSSHPSSHQPIPLDESRFAKGVKDKSTTYKYHLRTK